MGSPNRTPDGYARSTTPSGSQTPVFDAGEVNIEGRPAVVIYDNAANGAANLNLPAAGGYNGSQLILDVAASPGNEITLVAQSGDSLSNDPSPISTAENYQAISDGTTWTFYSLTPA